MARAFYLTLCAFESGVSYIIPGLSALRAAESRNKALPGGATVGDIKELKKSILNLKASHHPLKTRRFRNALQLLLAGILLLGTVAAGPAPVGQVKGSRVTVGLVKYKGGGDWYEDGRALKNLFQYIRQNTNIDIAPEPAAVEPSSTELFSYPVIYIAGHGNIVFSADDVANLRHYFAAGGFMFANDDYGMDKSFRREMKKVFPDADWMEVPFNHPVYHNLYQFPNGCPKIHEHDNLPAQGLGLFLNGVMVAYYNYQADLGDGWEEPDVYNDPPEKHKAALEMGTNVIVYALSRGVE
jgi:hypothetical protein